MELGEVFAGFAWRERQRAITTAYHVAQFTVGVEGLPSLEDLLDESPTDEASPEAFHRRMRELGWE